MFLTKCNSVTRVFESTRQAMHHDRNLWKYHSQTCELTLAGPNAFKPRVLKPRVPWIPTFLEPRTAAKATAGSEFLVHGASTFVNCRSRGWRCGGSFNRRYPGYQSCDRRRDGCSYERRRRSCLYEMEI